MRLKIKEAMARLSADGSGVSRKELAGALFPESTEECAKVKFHKLTRGDYKLINPDWIPMICEKCGCTADFLFGRSSS